MGVSPDMDADLAAEWGADAGPGAAIWSARLRRHLRRHRRAVALVRPLGWAVVLACLVILASYAIGFEHGYQLLPHGPGTSPLTAITLGLLGTGLVNHHPIQTSKTETVLVGSAIAIAILRMAELALGFSVLPWTSFHAGPHAVLIAFGWSDALGAALGGIALLSVGRFAPAFVQALLGLAIAPPLVALVGYSYGLTEFYGRTSLYTATILLTIATGTALASSRRGIVSVLLDPFTAGRLARIQLFGAFAIPYLIGHVLLRIGSPAEVPMIGFGVISTATFTIILMSVSLLALDRMDQRRRRAERAIYYAATHDHLTSLPNRRLFFDIAELDLNRVDREGTGACVVMIDLDRFKSVNDEFGHPAGDQVLKTTARAIAGNLRAGDLAARLGGEEFAIFLPDTSTDEAIGLAERLQEAMGRADFSAAVGKDRVVTLSAGIAARVPGRESLAALLAAADTALYAAKQNGRNRVEVAMDGPGLARRLVPEHRFEGSDTGF